MNLIHSSHSSLKVEFSDAARGFFPISGLELTREDTPESVIYRATLPDFRRRDITIEVRDRALIVRGERVRGFLKPQSRSSFVQAVTLPDTLDERDIAASFRGDVLSITVAKKPQARARRIAIRVPGAKAPDVLPDEAPRSRSWWTALKGRFDTLLRKHWRPRHRLLQRLTALQT